MEIYKERLVLVAASRAVSEEHLLPGRPRTVDPAKLDDLPFILSKKGHALFQRVKNFFEEHQLAPEVVFESTSNITSLRLAAAGLGVAIVPDMTTRLAQCPSTPAIYFIGVPPLEWNVALHYRKDVYFGGVERAFFETACQAFSAAEASSQSPDVHH